MTSQTKGQKQQSVCVNETSKAKLACSAGTSNCLEMTDIEFYERQ